MRLTLLHPVAGPGCDREFYRPATFVAVAQAAEAAGFDAIAFTDHPAPSQNWYATGGHDALDPFAALAFCAAATRSIRLMTYLLVLPYRNPFLAAKGAASVDVLSDGRLILAVGTGYLRSEFLALGVDFDERNELFDEALDVMRRAWSEAGLRLTGRHFRAPGQTAMPRPVQGADIPIWIGGNSAVARRRAALWGVGWTPLLIPADRAQANRTAAITDLSGLRAGIAEIHEVAAAAGRSLDGFVVQVDSPQSGVLPEPNGVAAHVDFVGQLADAGVDQILLRAPVTSVTAALASIEHYGAEVRPLLSSPPG